VTLIGENCVAARKRDVRDCVKLETINGQRLFTCGSVVLDSVECCGSQLGSVKAQVCSKLPSNVDVILGLDVISRSGLFIRNVNGELQVSFESDSLAAPASASVNCSDVSTFHSDSILLKDQDFNIYFCDGKWEAEWRWKDDTACRNVPRPNFVPPEDIDAFDTEIQSWIDDGVLVEHRTDIHGAVKNYLPLISVRQCKGEVTKVRPVCDYRELNKSIQSHPAGATPVCSERLREWRQDGDRCAVVDLKKAYLQIYMKPSLWPYQAVRWKGKDYLLTRLGFGLSSAPKIMTAIVEYVISSHDVMKNAVSSYIDDLYIKLNLINCDDVVEHLKSWGLITKPPEKIGCQQGVRVLGLKIGEDLCWERDGPVPDFSEVKTRRDVSGLVGSLLGHYPVAGWLRVVCGYIQRCVSETGIDWDENVSPEILALIAEVMTKLKTDDPVRGKWVVNPDSPINVWADASNLALGVLLEVDGHVIEDASWLRPKNDTAHINKSELEAVIRGLNLARRWGRKEIVIFTDSSNVFSWLRSIVQKDKNVRTRALEELLIRRRLNVIAEIIEEEDLKISLQLIRSSENKADVLTRVPVKWLLEKTSEYSFNDIKVIHDRSHFGVERTFQLAKEKFPSVSRRVVKKVVSRCDECSRIDPAATFRYDHGVLSSNTLWDRWAADITHVQGISYLTCIDFASGFAMWRHLRSESAAEVCLQMRQLFSELGPPDSIHSDNGSVFRSREFVALMADWGVKHTFSCAYRPQGNSRVERIHRTIKRSVMRTGRSVEEAVFWYNCTKGLSDESPFEIVFGVPPRKPGIAKVQRETVRVETDEKRATQERYDDLSRNPFFVGDLVYLRKPSGRCDDIWDGPCVVTKIISSVSVEIKDDGVPRHVSHLRLVPGCRKISANEEEDVYRTRGIDVDSRRETGSGDNVQSDDVLSNETGHAEDDDAVNGEEDDNADGDVRDVSGGEQVIQEVRRSGRQRQRPAWHQDYVRD